LKTLEIGNHIANNDLMAGGSTADEFPSSQARQGDLEQGQRHRRDQGRVTKFRCRSCDGDGRRQSRLMRMEWVLIGVVVAIAQSRAHERSVF
jgi:hypothetical protein